MQNTIIDIKSEKLLRALEKLQGDQRRIMRYGPSIIDMLNPQYRDELQARARRKIAANHRLDKVS